MSARTSESNAYRAGAGRESPYTATVLAGATSQPKQDNTTGQANQDKAHPGNSNQVGTPTTEPGSRGTQSGENPVTPDTGSRSSCGSTR